MPPLHTRQQLLDRVDKLARALNDGQLLEDFLNSYVHKDEMPAVSGTSVVDDAAPGWVYCDPSKTGTGDGHSWKTAKKTPNEALAAMNTSGKRRIKFASGGSFTLEETLEIKRPTILYSEKGVVSAQNGSTANTRFGTPSGTILDSYIRWGADSTEDFGNGINLYGGSIDGFEFDMRKVNRAAIHGAGANMLEVCNVFGQAYASDMNPYWVPESLIFAEPYSVEFNLGKQPRLANGNDNPGQDMSWWRVDNVRATRCAIAILESKKAWCNGWELTRLQGVGKHGEKTIDGVVVGFDRQTPYLEFRAPGVSWNNNKPGGRHAGHKIWMARFDGVGPNQNPNVDCMYFERMIAGEIAGINAENLGGALVHLFGTGIKQGLSGSDPRECVGNSIFHNIGRDGHNGYIKIAGQIVARHNAGGPGTYTFENTLYGARGMLVNNQAADLPY